MLPLMHACTTPFRHQASHASTTTTTETATTIEAGGGGGGSEKAVKSMMMKSVLSLACLLVAFDMFTAMLGVAMHRRHLMVKNV
jgi:hypothetical protein